ncbi:Polysaccharide lyase [Penicillium robsamsonii]|uniref:Polysaccharide lyase n=1 Tax=Penicillium robsamsonii TaxID=1792511 RepID=UPI002546DDDD|nr:Polysaccharide lyase [Penicillium robsamsonii]KAJ5822676.1 Polysaccharide lyase [Penicillium robsamsonii]
MLGKIPSVAALLALSLSAQASLIFKNSGTTSGWDKTNQEHRGTVKQVTDEAYEGKTALKMTQIYDEDYSGRYHSEVVKNDVYKRGDTGAYGFSFRLQDDWQFLPVQSYGIAQFIADFTDSGCEDWMPTTMVALKGDKLYSRVKEGSVCKQEVHGFNDLATVTAGEWHRIEIEAKWESDGTGHYTFYYDGEKVLDEQNISTTVEDDRAFQFRVGLYANGWHDDKQMKGSQGTRSIWYDEIAAGTKLSDVSSEAEIDAGDC